ncbi:hypothetical protein [Roseofilum casamattae]|uniref:Uncharacterized protein n=1 Tax=Roseofilum casamattae BLCC-M143 TaxID=3022442 RepID=A0ABT7BXB1_9CYAN|nr:hypothetical protein [Roseofilum casamattae]MDJ1183819.1 hypothetical protein [Roseofilum casamattae BLCC-M143]
MSSVDSAETNNEPKILRRVASLISLLGVSLFFTGWIYQSLYWYYFNLSLKTIELNLQYLFIIPLQVFLGDSDAVARSARYLLFMFAGIYANLWLVKWLEAFGAQLGQQIKKQFDRQSNKLAKKIFHCWLRYNPLDKESINLIRFLANETVIIAWVLIVLYNLARAQGFADYQRDIGVNSTLPVVALVIPEDQLPLGRLLKDSLIDSSIDDGGSLIDPSIEGFRYFGQSGMVKDIFGDEDNYIGDGTDLPERVWRLLLEQDDWIYLVQTFPKSQSPPRVVAIKESMNGEQLMILAPTIESQ